MTNAQILLLIAAAGAFGGFVDGLVAHRTYALRWRAMSVDIGSAGDVLVGAAAALAIFTFASSVFNYNFAAVQQADQFVRLVAWGVLSGFAGLSLLQRMSEKLVREIATKTAEETTKRVITEDVETELNVKEGDVALTKYDLLKENDQLVAREAEAQHFLETAFAKYEAALAKQPDDEHALRGKAKAFRRQADLATATGDIPKAKENWSNAIATLSTIIRRNSAASLAYYNLACYTLKSGGKLDDAIGYLTRALEISPALKESAKIDPDFEDLRKRNNKAFVELTGWKPESAYVTSR